MRGTGKRGKDKGGNGMKVQVNDVTIETNPLEWTIFLQIQTVIEDLMKGNLTRSQADLKLVFLLNLCGYINQETGKELG
jgi:hypothetical protein